MGRIKNLIKAGLLICSSLVLVGFIVTNIVIMQIRDTIPPHVDRAVYHSGFLKSWDTALPLQKANIDAESQPPSTPQLVTEVPCTVEIGVIATPDGNWTMDEMCPKIKCAVKTIQTLDYSDVTSSDVVYFQTFSGSISQWKQYVNQRIRGQPWVFVSYESPRNTLHLPLSRLYKHGFNWTVTYRTDSTFVSPYGRYVTLLDENGEIQNKTIDENTGNNNFRRNATSGATVMWMSSNCRATSWPRSKFVRLLGEHIQIDTYGRCGQYSCPRGPECVNIMKKYKFYLSLENSESKDYITEKFWDPLSHDVIPVVYGPSREDYEKVTPPHSFIHVEDFYNFSDLAKYLKKVGENETLFNQYFHWKRMGFIETNLISKHFEPKIIFCRVAEKIVNWRKSNPKTVETVDLTNPWRENFEDKNILGAMLRKTRKK